MCRHFVRVVGNGCTTGQWKSMEVDRVKSLVWISDVKFVWVVYVV